MKRARDDGRICLRVGSPYKQRRVLKQIRNAYRGYKNRKRRSRTERFIRKPLDKNAEHGADNDGGKDRNYRRDPCGERREFFGDERRRKEGDIASDHDNVSVREVKHLCYAVNHRITECDDGINASEAYPADKIREKFHKSTSFFFFGEVLPSGNRNVELYNIHTHTRACA